LGWFEVRGRRGLKGKEKEAEIGTKGFNWD